MSQPHRLKVLYVIWSLQTGGAERVVADLARRLDPERFEAMVCCLNFKGRLAEELEAKGLKVWALDKRPKLDPMVLVKLVRLMRREGVHVVHTHLWTSSFWGRLAAFIARVPVVVVTEHDVDTWRRGVHFAADRLLARTTDHFVFVSAEVEDFYRRKLVLAPERSTVVHNGIDLEPLPEGADRGEIRARLGIPGDGPVAGVVGRLEKRKGHRFFLEAMKTVAAEVPGARGLVVGEGVEHERLVEQRRALGVESSVHLAGYWPSVAEALGALDVFVLPSLMEGHPLAILEAMAASLPVVATRVGGNHEAVEEGVTGLLVEAGNPAALAEAVVTLLRDPERRREMGRAARRRFEERFSLDRAVGANADVYSECWKRQGGGTLA